MFIDEEAERTRLMVNLLQDMLNKDIKTHIKEECLAPEEEQQEEEGEKKEAREVLYPYISTLLLNLLSYSYTLYSLLFLFHFES